MTTETKYVLRSIATDEKLYVRVVEGGRFFLTPLRQQAARFAEERANYYVEQQLGNLIKERA